MPNTGNTQQIINYGATANDGTGDPLRTAFIKTDENFDNIWLAGPVGSNITIGNNTIQTNNTNGNIIIKPNGTGVIQANASIIPNSDNTRDLGSSTVAWRRAYINELLPETLTVSGDTTIGGNLTVEGDTIQIGNITTDTLTVQLANTAGNKNAANGAGITVGANDAIATFLFNSTSNTWTTNIGANVSGNITAGYFIGNGSLLTGTTGNSLVNGNSNVIVVSNGNVSVSANGTANILTITDANLGWNATQLAQVIVDGSLRAIFGIRAPSIDARSNIYSGVSDGLMRGGSLIITNAGNGNGVVTAVEGSFSGNISANNAFVANNITGVQNLNVKTGTFTGDSRGENSMYAGLPLFTVLGSDVVAQFSANVDSYTQLNFQNGNSGPLASGDFVITANNGNDDTFFFNMGLTSNNHSDPDFFGDTSTSNDAYIYVVGADATGPGDTGPGNLIIGSTNGAIKMFVGNTAQANVIQTLTRSGVTVTGNITANYFSGNGSLLTGISASTGNFVFANNQMSIANTVMEISATGAGADVDIEAADAVFIEALAGEVDIRSADETFITTDSGGNIWTFGIDGTLTAPGNISAGNINVSNNVNITQNLNVKTGTFTGDAAGDNSIYAGFPTFTVLGSDVVAQFSGNTDAYIQFNFQNGNTGNQASGDYVITADNGNDTTHFLNIGLTGGNWDGSQTNSLGNLLGPNDGYFYVQDGNLAIGTRDGSNSVVWTFTSDSNLALPSNTSSINYANGDSILGGYATISSSYTSNTTTQIINNPDSGGTYYNASTLEIDYTAYTGASLLNFDIAYQAPLTANIGIAVSAVSTPLIQSNTNIQLQANTGTAQTWTFDTTGNLTLPGNITGNVGGFAIGYRDIPQVAFTGNATIATADAGKHFYSTQSTDYILTIANNASQGLQTGAAITVINQGTGNITLAQGSGVTLYLTGNATSGNRTVTTFGMATLIKVATDTWFVSGAGVI